MFSGPPTERPQDQPHGLPFRPDRPGMGDPRTPAATGPAGRPPPPGPPAPRQRHLLPGPLRWLLADAAERPDPRGSGPLLLPRRAARGDVGDRAGPPPRAGAGRRGPRPSALSRDPRPPDGPDPRKGGGGATTRVRRSRAASGPSSSLRSGCGWGSSSRRRPSRTATAPG